MFNRYKLYVAIASATENTCRYWVLNGMECVYLSSKLKPIEIEALYEVERREYRMRKQFVFMLRYEDVERIYDIESLFTLGKTELNKWTSDDLELVGLVRCDYTDVLDYRSMMHIDVNGDYASDYAVDKHYVVECYECGEYYPEDEMRYADGDYYCDNCFDNNFSYCECCGCLEREGDGFWDDDRERWVCQDCFERYYEYCEYTRTYHHEEDMTRVRISEDDYTSVCEYYADNHLYWCSECSEWVDGDDWDDENDMCRWCSCDGSPIRDYHHTQYDLKFFGDAKWHIGCELEVATKYDNAYKVEKQCALDIVDNILSRDSVELKRDSSINCNGYRGFEIVTMPYSLNEWYRRKDRINQMLAMLKDNKYTSHSNGLCGLHFHISRKLFGDTYDEQENNIAKVVYFYNKWYDDVVKVSRRTEEQCQRWARKYDGCSDDYNCYDETVSEKDKLIDIVKNKKYYTRYKAVNLENRNTVEFRIMRGTLNETSFWACFDFTVLIAMNSIHINWDDIDNIDLWLSGMEKNTFDYIKTREAFKDASLLQ